MANIITGARVLCAVALLFCRPFSPAFYALYISAGFTDMIDGAVARKTNTANEFGAKLDTAADALFVVVCLVKLMPILNPPVWMIVWIAVIALIKMTNIVAGFVMKKSFVSEHTLMNRVTGAVLFVLPLTLSIIDLKYSGAVACAAAAFAAVQEGHIIWTDRHDERLPLLRREIRKL